MQMDGSKNSFNVVAMTISAHGSDMTIAGGVTTSFSTKSGYYAKKYFPKDDNRSFDLINVDGEVKATGYKDGSFEIHDQQWIETASCDIADHFDVGS